MESIARIQPSEAQEAEKSAELEALRAICTLLCHCAERSRMGTDMEEITVFEDDPALFKIDLLSTERKDPVRTVLKFRHPPLYPDEVLQVSAETLEVRLLCYASPPHQNAGIASIVQGETHCQDAGEGARILRMVSNTR